MLWNSNKLYTPSNHYARKNAGYLKAIKRGAKVILDTDDDNTPNNKWRIRTEEVSGVKPANDGWFNVYQELQNSEIWPRGFSLKKVKSRNPPIVKSAEQKSSIQQGLADGEPDIDAICRLTVKYGIEFSYRESVFLGKNQWCPFNSQSTWWFPKAFPLMYLPVFASFRMTDIWRSFVAQRCLWQLEEGVAFHSPSEVFQDRNEHDLMKDFNDEIDGYLKNDLIVEILSDLKLGNDTCENLLLCYEELVEEKILPQQEIDSLKQWIKDYEDAIRNLQ